MYEADGFHFLEVKKVSAEDVGMYSVTVQNSAGSDTAEAELEVFEKPKLLTRSGPEWEQALQNLTVEEDDAEVKLVCTCKDLTQPSVRWFHNGKELFSGFHMKIQHVAQTATLTIKAIQEKDAGEFKCVMTGKNGELETSCILSVGNPEIMEPPVFEKELHDMEVDEGDKLELDVEVKGPALPRVTWYHNNVEIMHDNSQYLITSLGNSHNLTVLHATSESSGEYVCEAYNDIGSTDTYCFIEVRDVKRPEPPSFVVHPTSLSANAGQTATFTCQVKGQPMPNVLWKKEGVALATDQKFKITRILDCHNLTVYNLSRMDQGEYTCYLHNTQGDMSYICTLHVTEDQDYSWQPQTADLKNKSRYRQIELAQRMSQLDFENPASNENQLLPSENVTEFKRKGLSFLGNESNNVEVLTSQISQRPLFDSTIGATKNPTQITLNPQFVNMETKTNNQAGSHQPVSKNSNLSSELDQIKPAIMAKYTNDNSVNQRSIHASNSHQQSTSDFLLPVDKFPPKQEGTKNVTNSAITDFRNVLKQRIDLPQQVNSQSNGTDFRRVISEKKTNNLKGNTPAPQTIKEKKNSPDYQTNYLVSQSSEVTHPHKFGSFSVTDDTTPLVSSALHYSADEKRRQMPKDNMHIKKETTIHNLNQTSIQQTINSSRNADVSSTFPTQSSSTVRRNWRSGNSQLPDKAPTIQDLNVTLGSVSIKNCIKETKPVNVLAKSNTLAGFFSICETSHVENDTDGAKIKLDGLETLNKTGNTSLKNVIQAGDAEAFDRRGSVNSKCASLDPSQQQVPDSYYVKQDHFSFESEELALKHTPLKVNLSKLTTCKVNLCEFNPSEPQSEATTLEMTSVSASVPLRQSLTSPPFHPQHYSIKDLDQQTAQSSDVNIENKIEVFADTSTENVSIDQKFNSNPEITKQNLRSFGSNFTWEKTPGDAFETRKGILSKKSSEPDNINQSKNTTESQIKRMNNRLSEKPPYYKNLGHQEKMKLTNRFSMFSTSETSSFSDNVAQQSNVSSKVKDNIVDDFRKVQLKSAPGITKDKFDLAKSKFMSKSTESIFTDVKLKPVSKPKDSYKMSEISSNADRIRASSKSIDFSKMSPLKHYSNYSPISKTNITPANITPKFSDCVKTFSSDAKPKNVFQNSRYQNPTQSSKIRASCVKNEKPFPTGITTTNSNRKSKGVGAQFEAVTKDSKASKEQMPYTSLHIDRSKHVDVKVNKEQMPYVSLGVASSKQVDVKVNKEQMPYASLGVASSKQVDAQTPKQYNFNDNNSGEISGSYQHLQISENAYSKECLQKNENTAGKPNNTSNPAMDSSSEYYQEKVTDWIKKRQSVQIDEEKHTSSGNKLSEAGKFSVFVPDSSKKLEDNRETTETNSLIKANRASIPNSSSDGQQVKTDLPNSRKFFNDTEIRIRARSRRANLKESTGIEWPPNDSVKTEVKQGTEHSEIINTEVKHAYKDQQPDESSRDSTKLISDADFSKLSRTSFHISKNNLGALPDLYPKQSELQDNDKLNSSNEVSPRRASVSKEVTSISEREPQVFTTVITMTPKIEAEKLTSSLILTKSMTGSTIPSVSPSYEAVNYRKSSYVTIESKESSAAVTPQTSTTSPPTNAEVPIVSTSWKMPGLDQQHHPEESAVEYGTHASTVVFGHLKQDSQTAQVEQVVHVQCSPGLGPQESQTKNQQAHSEDTSVSWAKPRSQRRANIYPVNDNEPSSYKEPLKLLNDDSESVLSMASISSSSSDASNVTADSGYTRQYFRRHVGNEMNHLVSEILHPENNDSWNEISYPRERNELEFSGTKLDVFEPTNVKQNTDGSRQDIGLNKSNEDNTRLNTNLQHMTSKHKEESTVEYDDQPTRNSLRQLRNQLGDSGHAHKLNSVGFLKDADSIPNVNENILTNLTTDSSGSVFISRRQRRLLEKTSTSSNDSGFKPEDGDNLSKSHLSEFIKSQTTFSEFSEPEEKESSLSYENPPLEKHFSRTEGGNWEQNFAMRDAKSDSTIWESRMSTELDRPKSKFDLENIKQEKNTYTTETSESDKSKEGMKANFSFTQKESLPMKKRSFFNDNGDVFYSTGTEADSSKDKDKSTFNDVSVNSSANQRRSFFDKDLNPNQRYPQDNYLSNQDQRSSIDKDSVKDEKHSRYQYRTNSLDKTALMSSTTSYHNETPLSTSQIELTPQTRPAISIMSSSALPILSVQQPGGLETGNDLQYCPPSFPVPLHDISVTLGATAVLQCEITGNPLPEVKWLLNLKQLEPSEGIEITASEETSRLTITHVTSGHAGDYTCWAKNLLGTVSSHCTLSLDDCHPLVETKSSNSCGIPEAITKTDVGSMSTYLPHGSETEQALFDIGDHGTLPFCPRDVVINTKDKFEDLYAMEEEVGRGKFGVVYKCKQKTDNTVWAAKVIKCREKAKLELRKEIEIMNKLRHPKLLLLWDAFETPRQVVMVMEYISAGELFERVIADDFYLTENDCIHFMRQICEGVGYMHSNGIIHLDLKPENILCVSENSNRIKIIDFGLAQFYKPGQSKRVLFGTPEFIAPEVINYDEISFETDIWSLGVICYVLLSGLSPFLGDNETETLANVTNGEYDFDDEAFDEISDLAKDFIGKLLVKRKEDRLLTDQCLDHLWLNQDEVDGPLAKRLNTEKLKRFMVRRKWLKTGNAVKAVSRLLKSNSLTGLGSIDRSISSDSGPDTPFYKRTISTLQSTAEIQGDDDDESNFVFDQITPSTSNTFGFVPEKSTEAISSSREENFLSSINQNNYSKMDTASTSKNTARSDTLPISSDKNNVQLMHQVISEERMGSVSRKLETNYSNDRSSRSVPRETGLNENFEKSLHLTSTSAPKEKDSLQINNKQTEATHLPRQSNKDTVYQAPCFTKSMTRCKTCAGDVARFAVIVNGSPPLHVTWLFEGDEIHSDTRHTLSSSENTGTFSLTIRNVEEDDEGEYTCKAVNSQGECTCSAELAVLLL